MANVDPISVIDAMLAGDFFGGILSVYTTLMGDLFWAVIFLTLSMGLYLRTKSLGMLFVFTFIFSAGLISTNLLPLEMHRYVYGMLALLLASMLYWIFAGRER